MSRASVLAVVALGAAAAALPAAGQDRYGPSGPAYQAAAMPQPGAAAAAFRGRTLSWPGKQDPTAPAPAYAPPMPIRAYAPQSYGAPAYRSAIDARPGYAPSAFDNSRYAAPERPAPYARRLYPGSTTARLPYAPARQAHMDGATTYAARPQAYAQPSYAAPAPEAPNADGWRPVFAEAPSRAPVRQAPADQAPALAGAPSRPADLPTSIYTPASTPEMSPAQRAAAAPPPLRTASAAQRYGYDPSQGHQVRFYSVHRPFGLQPDAAPIPPQFFTATADLSQPAGPLPTDRTTTTTTASGARVSHVAPDTSVN